jgi:hypothetical protein
MGAVVKFLRDNWLVIVVVGGLAAAWLLLRTPGADLASTADFDQRVRAGQPVVVEFYSNT